jgi:hypothetical protein
MASIFEILPILGAILAGGASAYAINMVLRQRRAESRLRRRLTLDRAYQRLLNERNLLAHARESSMSEEELDALMRIVSKELHSLDEGDRERIEEALYQVSERGRRDYLYKLVEETGPALEPQR